MKRKIFGLLGAFAVVGVLLPVVLHSRVKDTPHKLTGVGGVVVANQEICRPCHTPHNASTVVGYLWNHDLSAGGWTLHTGADSASVLNSTSRLCLSCHDGTVAIDSYGGLTGTVFLSGTRNLGSDLTTSHPIGVDYPTDPSAYNQPDANGDVIDTIETPAGQSAHIEDGKVQCGSCHFAHGSNAPFGMFLRVDNTGSRLCMTCHVSPG